MKKLIIGLILVVSVLLLVVCSCWDKFADDPIKWSSVGGDGTWDSNSRRWTVYLSPGETKSIKIRLYNSSSRRIVVCTVPVGPTDILPSRQVRCPVPPGMSVVITLTATAYQWATPGSHRYTMNYSNSYNREQ